MERNLQAVGGWEAAYCQRRRLAGKRLRTSIRLRAPDPRPARSEQKPPGLLTSPDRLLQRLFHKLPEKPAAERLLAA